jgi:hypothetical protein
MMRSSSVGTAWLSATGAVGARFKIENGENGDVY